VAIVFFFPVAWMVLTALQPARDVGVLPPKFLFHPTFQEFRNVFSQGIALPLRNSVVASVVSVAIVILLAVPAAYALSIHPVKRWRDVLFFFLSTKMLPIAGAIAPIFIIAKDLHLLDTIWVLIILYTSMNMPIAVWMLRSFMLEIPHEVLDAAEVDGAGFVRTATTVIAPMLAPGIAACALLCFIFAWNEFFLAVNLTSTTALTLPVFLVGFITSEGAFWAQLAAAGTLCAIPVIVAGWIAQNRLVRGLSFGALK
jgi:sorbitol/mannitol transport system permease protein